MSSDLESLPSHPSWMTDAAPHPALCWVDEHDPVRSATFESADKPDGVVTLQAGGSAFTLPAREFAELVRRNELHIATPFAIVLTPNGRHLLARWLAAQPENAAEVAEYQRLRRKYGSVL